MGKTSVVERLAERLEARTVLEEWGQNPFLKPFYEGTAGRRLPDRALLPALALPAAAGARAAQALPELTLSDYVFEKSKLFAYLNLEDSELLIYEKLYSLLAESVPRPDLVVYLQAPTEVLMQRIRTRGPARGGAPLRGVPRGGEPRLQPLLLPLHADAAPRGEHHGRGLRHAARRTWTTS